ncbi:hypothetical protein BBJ28_00007203 [Nothophytophthora sp. Chile5]|nr:hypothetical protein BBJ28_00007203 [Nothophytophthora sp. Chile5]
MFPFRLSLFPRPARAPVRARNALTKRAMLPSTPNQSAALRRVSDVEAGLVTPPVLKREVDGVLVSDQNLHTPLSMPTTATVKSETEAGSGGNSAATMEDSKSDILSASQRKKRRRSYISPSSNVPSLAGGAQRVLTPTRRLQNGSDDGGMEDDSDGGFGTQGTSHGVSVDSAASPRYRNESDSTISLETVTPYKEEGPMGQRQDFHDTGSPPTDLTSTRVKEEVPGSTAHQLRETLSFATIGGAVRVLHNGPSNEGDAEGVEQPHVKEEQQNTFPSRVTQVKEERQVVPAHVVQVKQERRRNDETPLPGRVTAASHDNNAKAEATTPQLERKLVFPQRVTADSATNNSGSFGRVLQKSGSNRKSLEESKPLQSLSERLAGNPKWEMDDFIVTRNLGQGKFGNVYLAKEKYSNVTVALKVLFKSPLTRDGGACNLKREVEIQARLRHPNVLQMHGYFYDDSCVYLVLEYAPYGELYKELAREKFFSDGIAACYVAQVVDALKYCHKCNVIHRDIKPENLLLGYNQTIKLADFGWSVHAPQPHNLRKTFCGTPDYLSPEMLLGETYDFRTDSWSLGVLTYELLVGATPFYCENQMEMYKRIQLVDYKFPESRALSESAQSFIAGLLQRKPEDRMSLEDAAKHPWILNRSSI